MVADSDPFRQLGAGGLLSYTPPLMTKQPIEFLRDTFPKLFIRGVGVLESRAAGGDERAQRILADVKGVTGAVRLEVDDHPPIVLSGKAGLLTSGNEPEEGVPLKATAKIPGDAVELLLGSALALAGQPLSFVATVRNVPELGDVILRVAFNVPEVPAEPGFTTELQFSDLEAVRHGELTVQELFLGGKLKMEGDYSLALQISMQLLTNPL